MLDMSIPFVLVAVFAPPAAAILAVVAGALPLSGLLVFVVCALLMWLWAHVVLKLFREEQPLTVWRRQPRG